jgi:transcriptional regulator with XRE-family HTH domain
MATDRDARPAAPGDDPSAPPGEGEEARFDGRSLILLRHARGLTQGELSDRSGVSTGTISRIENGKTYLDSALRESLARGLGVPPFVFDDIVAVLDYVDRMAGQGALWNVGSRRGASPGTVRTDEVGEDSAQASEWSRYLEDTLLADAAGRSMRELLLRVLERLRDPPGRA